MSVTEPKVPRVLARTTVPPEVVRLFPLASFNCTVIVEVLVPFAVIDEAEADIVDCESEADPATVVIVGVVPVRPLSVAVTVVAVPDTVWVVSVTVAMPLA